MIKVNKSLATNITALFITAGGYFSPLYRQQLLATGAFALSGAITNWLAVYMLFDRIPFVYGSGVVPLHFEDFKKGIKNLVTEQFFSEKNIALFASSASDMFKNVLNRNHIKELIDYDLLFDRFTEAILASSFGSMLGILGGRGILEGLRKRFKEKMEAAVTDMIESGKLEEIIEREVSGENTKALFRTKLDEMIDARLEELTPQMVKEIIQKMIKKHLGWLVVWGGVFGGLIGLAVSFTG
ncbi:MAG: DUF445 domain-containing protein [Spirochaetia bacterium]|nr:DUF445 domain-containing protein [Spirochaetia bacterium]